MSEAMVTQGVGEGAGAPQRAPGYDKPSTVAEQLQWLAAAGLQARVTWAARDLAVLVADLADRDA